MDLTQEERNALVEIQLEKARYFLGQADEMIGLSYWDIAANRYYFACFHAVQALITRIELSAKSHEGLIAMFGLNFIKTNIISKEYGSFLEQLRAKGGYDCLYSVSEEEVRAMKEPSTKLIDTISDLI